MGRKHNNTAMPRGRLVAYKEKRGGKVISAYRRVEQEDSDMIGARLLELAGSEDIPPLRVAKGLRAFVLDPRLSGRDFNRGYLSAVLCRKVIDQALDQKGVDADKIQAKLEEPELLQGKRRTILVPLGSTVLSAECRGFNTALAHFNVPGFSASGKKSGNRGESHPKIAIATFVQPVSKASESDILEAVGLGLDLALMEQDGFINLGELKVQTHPVERSPDL